MASYELLGLNEATPQAVAPTASDTGVVSNLTVTTNLTNTAGTANGVTYLNGSKVLTSGAALQFDGTDLILSSGVKLGGTAAANLLDDYEEGTWTPAFGASSGSATYTTQTGNYVKVGRQVTVVFHIKINVSSALVFNGEITGLPFTGANNNYAATTFSYWHGDFSTSCNVIGLTGATNTIQVRVANTGTSAPSLALVGNTFSNGTEIAGTLTYFV